MHSSMHMSIAMLVYTNVDAHENTRNVDRERAPLGSLRKLLNDSRTRVVGVESVQLQLAAGIGTYVCV